MSELVRQRIKYLVERGGLWYDDEPATKRFFMRWMVFWLVAHIAVDILQTLLT